MTRISDLLTAALAPAIWGTTYLVTSLALPDGYPPTVAMLRALPAGLVLLAIVRQLPPITLVPKVLVLGALNFTVFWALLFVAAYRLPGGVAATLGAVQPLAVLYLSYCLLGARITFTHVAAALTGLIGVALLVLGPTAKLDATGTLAALGGALSMATGVVLTRKWQPTVSPLTFTAWQLTAGGLLLLPLTLLLEPNLPPFTLRAVAGLVWLGGIGAAFTYFIWFRGIARLGPSSITLLGALSPLTAVCLDWLVLGRTFTAIQTLGALVIVLSLWLGSRAAIGAKP